MMLRISQALLLLAFLVLASPVAAITLEEAARKAAKENNAQVLSARTVTRRGERVHEIKILTKDGVVKTIRIPEDSS